MPWRATLTQTKVPPRSGRNPKLQNPLHNGVSVFSHKLLNLSYDPIDFVDEIAVIAVLAKRGNKRSVIPEGAVLFPTEPLEHLQTVPSQLGKNRARVM